jgi:hypothetical protein
VPGTFMPTGARYADVRRIAADAFLYLRR